MQLESDARNEDVLERKHVSRVYGREGEEAMLVRADGPGKTQTQVVTCRGEARKAGRSLREKKRKKRIFT